MALISTEAGIRTLLFRGQSSELKSMTRKDRRQALDGLMSGQIMAAMGIIEQTILRRRKVATWVFGPRW